MGINEILFMIQCVNDKTGFLVLFLYIDFGNEIYCGLFKMSVCGEFERVISFNRTSEK